MTPTDYAALEARALRAGAEPPLEVLGEGMEGVVFVDARELAFKVGKWFPDRTLADEAELMRLLSGTPVAAHVPRFVAYVPEVDVLVREAVQGEALSWYRGGATEVFRVVRAAADQLDYVGIEAKEDNVIQTPDGRLVVFDLGFVSPIRARGVRTVEARLADPRPLRGDEAFDLSLTIRQLAVHDPEALSLAAGLALLTRLEARTGRTFEVRRDFEDDLRRQGGVGSMTTGLGKTPWVDKALAAVLDEIEREVSPDMAPVPVLNARKGRVQFTEYGCGHYGCVLPTRTPGVVLKVTSDPSEAWFVAHVLRGDQEETAGLVRYHAIYKLRGLHKRRETYAIWRQEAHEVGGFAPFRNHGSGYEPSEMRRAERRLGGILEAGRVIRERYQRAKTPEAWFDTLHAAAAYEDRADDLVGAHYDEAESLVTAMKGTRNADYRLAIALSGFGTYTELLANEAGLYLVGDALHTYFERGFVLADVHTNNLGKPLDETGWNTWIITDPGHAVPLRPDLLRVEIKEL